MEEQLSFLDIFTAAAEETATAHLPSTIEAALPFYREMLGHYHAAMLADNAVEAARIEKEAHNLALRLNNHDPGILADDTSSGNVLKRETAAAPGEIPLWGQAGIFVVDVDGLKVRIDTKGLFGIGGAESFCANAVDKSKPFLSETGFRSFMGGASDPLPGMAFDEFVRDVLRVHIAKELKGKLRPIQPRYREEETLDMG